MRGIQAATYADGDGDGITPACAGNTQNTAHAQPRRRDHPRVCGEYPQKTSPRASGRGSPPRVRGIPIWLKNVMQVARITPACAGNTIFGLLLDLSAQDHPRVCGEYPSTLTRKIYAVGSPPRVRGIPISLTVMPSASRITPACAGNTRTPPRDNSLI